MEPYGRFIGANLALSLTSWMDGGVERVAVGGGGGTGR